MQPKKERKKEEEKSHHSSQQAGQCQYLKPQHPALCALNPKANTP